MGVGMPSMCLLSGKELTEKVIQCLGDEQPIHQASWLKQAWAAIYTAQYQQVAAKNCGTYVLDLDAFLDTQTLNVLRDTFYAMHHLQLAPYPGQSDYRFK